VTENRWDDVDAYIGDLFVGRDDALDAALKASDDAGLPSIAVSPPLGKFLLLLAKALGASTILEIGTLGGYSTIWLARGLPGGGRLVTLELDQKHADIARSNLERAEVADRVEIVVGPALETLNDVEGPFDLIFIDADKDNYPGYFEHSVRLSRPGTVIVADNVVRDGEVINTSSNDPRIKGVQRFNELVAADERVSATEIQTVGAKGYDGFAFIVVGG
jgi:predicted O-methyltransferase YrrM